MKIELWKFIGCGLFIFVITAVFESAIAPANFLTTHPDPPKEWISKYVNNSILDFNKINLDKNFAVGKSYSTFGNFQGSGGYYAKYYDSNKSWAFCEVEMGTNKPFCHHPSDEEFYFLITEIRKSDRK